jgi:hypothetical protein
MAAALNLDDYMGDDVRSGELNDTDGLVEKAVAPGVENEKCVIAAYRTTEAQVKAFQKLLDTSDRTNIPLEWVIDIADESNGWFYGTAYNYNDVTAELHVMVPDKLNPTFDGYVPLDHRTVHLIECVDKKTDALFNKIVRDSVVKIRWEVEWFEEHEGADTEGRWILSTARFLVRIANQLLVEDEDFGQDTKGFVMLTADHNLRLRKCIRGKGVEDFRRLIGESIVQSAPGALDSIEYPTNTGPATPVAASKGNQIMVPMRKLADMGKSLREYFAEIMDERDRLADERIKYAERFNNFILNGDLDAGLMLYDFTDVTVTEAKDANSPEQEQADAIVEKAWNLCNRLERGLAQVIKVDKGAEEKFSQTRRR